MATLYCPTLAGGSTDIKVVDSVAAALTGAITCAAGVTFVAVSPDGAMLAASLNDTPGHIQLIPTATGTPGPEIALGHANPGGLVWSWDSTTVYVKCSDAVVPVSRTGTVGTPLAVTSVGPTAVTPALAITNDGSRLYAGVGSASSIGVSQIDVASWAVTNTWTIGGTAGLTPFGLVISPDAATVYLTRLDNAVLLLDVASGAWTTLLAAAGTAFTGACLSAAGADLYAVDAHNGSLFVVDRGTFAFTHNSSPAIPGAQACVALHDGSEVWVNTLGSHNVESIPTATWFGGAKSVALDPSAFSRPIAVTQTAGGSGGPGGGTITGTAGLPLGPLVVAATSIVTAPTLTGTAVLNIGPVVVAATDNLTTRTGTAAVRLGPLVVVAVGANIGPNAYPVPGFRGRWRLTLHQRAYAPATLASTIIAELTDARARQLVQAWNTPATLTFTLDGHAPAAALIAELQHDVVAWRWDDQTGQEIAVFRGPVTQSQDTLDEQSHAVAYTCHDYVAMLQRRILTATYTVTGRDQDLIAGDLLGLASSATTSAGASLSPASYLPMGLESVAPGGALRGLSGQLRDRTYYGSQNVGQAVDDLAKVLGGFDYDVQPSAVDASDSLRVFYPAQGVTRADVALQYGSTVAALTRSVDSAAYANYVRCLGNNSSANPTPQLYGEAAAAGAATTTAGLWMLADDAANVTVAATLTEKAQGDINLDAVLVPAYTLTLAPGAYTWGHPNMGDTVPLIVQSGRLNVNSNVRVLGIAYLIGDDGQEDVTLTVARPPTQLVDLLTKSDQSVKALAQR